MTVVLNPEGICPLEPPGPRDRRRFRLTFDRMPAVRHRDRVTIDEQDYFVQRIGKTDDFRHYEIVVIEA